MESFSNGHGFVEVLSTPQGCDMHNRRWSAAQPPELLPHAIKSPAGTRLSNIDH
ncbi:MAG: hypothetical protein LBK82_09540 [Planctomycetaceae bacterium]|nr:hypothetical protein [Planctomycetaceae bacterium]